MRINLNKWASGVLVVMVGLLGVLIVVLAGCGQERGNEATTGTPQSRAVAEPDIWALASAGNGPELARRIGRDRQLVNAECPDDKYARMTPLHFACAAGRLATAQYLVAAGADVGAISKYGFTPLHMVTEDGVSLPIGSFAEAQPQHFVSLNPNAAAIAGLLIESGARVNAVSRCGWTPLHSAALCGDAELCKVLLKAGAEMRADNSDQTPLHWAAAYGHVEVVRLLIQHGANLQAMDLDGFAAIHFAAANGHVDVVRVLLEAGDPVDHPAPGNMTALYWAAYYRRAEMVKFLLGRGANRDAKNMCGVTPGEVIAERLPETLPR